MERNLPRFNSLKEDKYRDTINMNQMKLLFDKLLGDL